MALFGPKETIDLSEPGEVQVSQAVASQLPDAGEWFLQWISPVLDSATLGALHAEVEGRRASNGSLVHRNFGDVPNFGRKQTPLTFLSAMTSGRASITTAVWATSARRGGNFSKFEKTIEELVRTQGPGAAATWAIIARPDARLEVRELGRMLEESWAESVSFLTNGDLIKAVRNWRR